MHALISTLYGPSTDSNLSSAIYKNKRPTHVQTNVNADLQLLYLDQKYRYPIYQPPPHETEVDT